MTNIDGCGGYVPLYRIDREVIADQHNSRASGECAVPSRDENHITMACEAAGIALERSSADPDELGAVLAASTTDPFAEHGIAAQVAYRVGAPESLRTGDYRGTTRAATDALAAGRDAVEARDAPVLVVAADVMPADSGTDEELEAGAGAGAVVLSSDADNPTATLEGIGEATTGFVERHRRHDESVTPGDDRFERRYGATPAIDAALERAGVKTPNYGVVVAPDGRTTSGVFRGDDTTQISTRDAVGFTGPSSFLLDLAYCLESANTGSSSAAVCYGAGGADAVALEIGTVGDAGRTVDEQLECKEYVSYAKHLEYRTPVDYKGVPYP